MPRSSDGRTRRALVIGIDRYTHRPLQGCVADAQLIEELLRERFDFEAKHIRVLHNEQARRDAILAELDALVDMTGPDDVAFVFYAGHGSQMREEGEGGDEASGMDSTLMCCDDPREDIVDDEFAERLALLGARTPHTVLVFDSCNSGTFNRDAFGSTGRFAPPLSRAAAPHKAKAGAAASSSKRRERAASKASFGVPTPKDRYVLIAACRDDEIAQEAAIPGDESVRHGALTLALCDELRKARARETWRDVFERTAARVTANDRTQHPQLAGAADREIFGLEDIPAMRFAPVVDRATDSVRLGVGAVHGATKGSTFTVYPQGTKSPEDAKPLGTVKIVSVGAATSRAEIVKESSAGAIAEGARAVETEHAYARPPLAIELVPVGVEERDLAALRALLEKEETLKLVKSSRSADVRVYRLASRERAGAKDPLPMLGALPSDTWAVAGRDGRLLAPIAATTSAQDVVRWLTQRADFVAALALDNVDPASRVRGNVTLELLRKNDAGEWVALETDETAGLPVVTSGERIEFRIASALEEPIYVTLLDFEPTGAVSEPTRGGLRRLAPGETWNVSSTGDGRGLRLSWDGDDAVESFKLFATVQPVDVSFLLRGAATTRGAEQVDPLSQDDWTSVVKSVVMRRKA